MHQQRCWQLHQVEVVVLLTVATAACTTMFYLISGAVGCTTPARSRDAVRCTQHATKPDGNGKSASPSQAVAKPAWLDGGACIALLSHDPL